MDLSGEPQFLEEMQLRYNEEAEKKGIYIVGSCGFDSIPSDLGQMVVHRYIKQKQFQNFGNVHGN